MRRSLPSAAIAAGCLLSAAQAQTPPASPGALENIVVTARRRSEPLQKVPVAVTVLSAAQLKRDNLNNVQDILAQVPSADFRTSSSNKDRTIFIRGIGTISTSPGVEPSVSTVLDDVVLLRAGQSTLDLAGLDQVEVLRGPQGTLFGKNASAGLVNITTREPTADLHAYVDAAGYSGGGEYRLEGGVSGTLAPNLTATTELLAGGFGGNVENAYNGKEVNGYTHDAFRTKLEYTPSDSLKIRLEADYLKSHDTVPNGVPYSTAQTAYPSGVITQSPLLERDLAASGVVAGTNNTTISNNTPSTANDDNGGISLRIDKQFNDYTLSSITAYRIWHNTQHQDYDQTSLLAPKYPQLADTGYLLFNQFTQELRFASPKGGFIDYQLGLFYALAVDSEQYDRDILRLVGPKQVANRGQAQYGTDGNDIAVFGEANLHFTDRFRGVLGLRLVEDTLEYQIGRVSNSAVAVTGIAPSFHSEGDTNISSYSDRAGLQYDLTPESMAYFTYSRGYKGPAFNVFFNETALQTNALKPETSNAYEVGLKTRLLQDRVQANLAGFIQDFTDYQANFASDVAGALVTRLINAGSVSTKGVEGDLTARPAHNLDLTGLFAYTEATVDHFSCPANAATSCNINGEPLPFAPKWKLDARAHYTIPLTERYSLGLNTDFNWQSSTQYQLTETPNTVQKAYGIWNASVGLADLDHNWRVTGLVRNILDTHYASYLVGGNLNGALGGTERYVPRDNSRYFGLELHKDF
jgi:iron complex outermembrane receptor protein